MDVIGTANLVYKKYNYTPPAIIEVNWNRPSGFSSGPHSKLIGGDHAEWIRPQNFNTVPPPNNGISPNFVSMDISGELHINEDFANTLTPGNYSTTVKVIADYKQFSRSSFTQHEHFITVNIEIIDTIPLEVTPSVLTYTYTPPGTNLIAQNLTISSENNWSITATESWVVLSKSSGFRNDFVSITADPSGLSAGAHDASIVINDGVHSRTVNVIFLVSGTISETDFLRVNPIALEYLSLSNKLPSQTKQIRIESSSEYSTRFVNDRFTINNTEDLGGIDELTIQPHQQILSNGIYQDILEIFTTLTTVRVFLTLVITDAQIQTIQNGGLYYVEDRDKISLVSTSSSTEGLFSFIANITNENINYHKEVPFYRGIAETLVGQEVRSLLNSVEPPSIIEAGITKIIDPVNIALTISEKEINSSSSIEHSNYIDLFFINGKSPTIDRFLSKIPRNIHTTVHGVVMLSFYASVSPSDISIRGDIERFIPISSITNNGVYTAVVSISSLGVNIGDNITVEVNGYSVEVSIIETEMDETLFIFENEWQAYEAITLTGVRKVSFLKGWDYTTVNNNGKRHSRLIEARPPRQFEIGIGKVYSAEQLNWIGQYFHSKRMFIEFNGERIEVEPLSSNFPLYETNKTFYDEVLKFKEAIV